MQAASATPSSAASRYFNFRSSHLGAFFAATLFLCLSFKFWYRTRPDSSDSSFAIAPDYISFVKDSVDCIVEDLQAGTVVQLIF